MKFANFKNSAQMLSASQMKKVKGGSGNCGYRDPNGFGACNMTKAEAICQIITPYI